MKSFYSTISFLCLLLCISCQQEDQASKKEAMNTTNEVSSLPINTTEQHRPHFHFTPPEKWMNDPNGMVYYKDEYHLFYQYYPEDIVWGPMHWGHAVSKDMVTWEHLPIALYPDSLGYIFSGSAVIDWKNTSGFGKNGEPPMVAIFTYHNMEGEKSGANTFQYQGIAYSNDKGRTFTKYEGNPVIPNPGIRDFRDPKVIWDEASNQWVMVFAAWNQVKLYGSTDLKNWTHLSDFGKEWGTHAGVWECPDLFPMTIEGTSEKKWVLLQSLNPGGANGGSGTQYFVGDFDGKNFKVDPVFATHFKKDTVVWLDYGRDNYAGVTWSDIPSTDGRRLFMGWMSNWDYAQKVPTENWRSAMTVARNLVLKQTDAGLRLLSQPVKELEKLRGKMELIANKSGNNVSFDFKPDAGKKAVGELILNFSVPKGAQTKLTVTLSNDKKEQYTVGYSAASNTFFSDRRQSGKIDFVDKFAKNIHEAPRFSNSETIQLHLYFDVASAELFADNGLTTMTDIFFPTSDYTQLRIQADNGAVEFKEGKIYWFE